MFIKTILSTCSIWIILSTSGVSAFAQLRQGVTEESYARARQVLYAAVQALGGSDAFRKNDGISLTYSSLVFDLGQSASPAASYYIRQEDGTILLDLRGKRASIEHKTNYLGGDAYRGRQVLKDKSGFTLDLTTNTAYPIAPGAVASRTRSVHRMFPHLLLQEALTRAGTLRWLGERTEEGHGRQVICFADVGGNQIALYFDDKTNLLTKFEIFGDDPVFGDVLRERFFYDYRDVGDLKVPSRVTVKYAGEIVSELNYNDIKIDPRPSDELFEVPNSSRQGPETLGPLSPATTKLADGVYFVNGMSAGDVWFYSQLFVEFKEFVLVVESPVNNNISQAVIGKIKELVPNKPIKYLVPTHYHFDHLGGVRGYLAEGATVLTTPGNRELIEKVAIAPHTIRPDVLSTTRGKVPIETFTGKRTFSDGKQTVELYSVASPHVEEMVIVYLPKERILFVSDLCMTRITGELPPPSQTSMDFARTIKKLDLKVQTIANGHGWLGTMEQILSRDQDR